METEEPIEDEEEQDEKWLEDIYKRWYPSCSLTAMSLLLIQFLSFFLLLKKFLRNMVNAVLH